jgi:outer membrane protein assembly factor BamB
LRAVQIGGRTVIQAVTNGAESDGPAGELCTAAPLGVVLRTDDQLKCYDPVDGDILWQRRGMPVSGNAFGDADYLFLIADGEAEGVVLSMIDGSTIGKWSNPEGKMLLQCGRNVVVTLFQAGKRLIRIVDPLDGQVLVERSYAGPTKYSTLAPSLVAAMEPDGKFEVLDAETGDVRFAQQLLPEEGLDSIYLMRSGNLLVLATNLRSAAQHNTSGHQALDNAPIVTGHVYALDAESGEPQWSQPATVAGQGFWQLQPTDSPVLAFISRFEDRQTNRQTGYMRVLCLDKRTGRSLVREDRLRDVDSLPWVMRIDQSTVPSVTLDLRHTEITMRFTDAPRPPEPIALEEVEGVTKSAGAGLFGIFRRFSSGSLSPPAAPPLDVDD